MGSDSVAEMISATHSSYIANKTASRVFNRDASLYAFSDAAYDCASRSMGWADLCTNPPIDPKIISDFAKQIQVDGIDRVYLIGQGGSVQSAIAVSHFMQSKGSTDMRFIALDSAIPTDIINILDNVVAKKSLFIVSSKSGKTADTLAIFRLAWKLMSKVLGDEASQHFVAITGADTQLGIIAKEKHFRGIFDYPAEVGGRFSALSIVGLLPFALLGVDLEKLMEHCASVELACASNDDDNPAISLASYIYGCLCAGKNIMHLICDEPCGSFGFWMEQLVAESLGKQGKGILLTLELDFHLLESNKKNVCALSISDSVRMDSEFVNPEIPCEKRFVGDVYSFISEFIVCEYALAMVATLLEVNPFDQPDVETAKKATSDVVKGKRFSDNAHQMRISESLDCGSNPTVDEALKALFGSIPEDGYCSINAFLPQTEPSICSQLLAIRVMIAQKIGRPTCLEMGPRYLHSVGQYHKGGPNNGAFLILSSNYEPDVVAPEYDTSFGQFTYAQALGDFKALACNGRKVVHLHFDNADANAIHELSRTIENCLSR